MRRDEVLATIRNHWNEIETFNVQALFLFGSVARDEARPDSDIDLLVEFAGPATFDGYMGLKIYLEDLFGCSVDLVTHRALKPRLRPMVEKEAIRVA